MTTVIKDLFNSVPGTKNDWRIDWKDDAKADFITDWASDAATVPVNSVAPAISGNIDFGSVLTVSDGTWSNSPTFTYQWLRGTTVIDGATASTYTLAAADVGSTISAVVHATNTSGEDDAAAAATATIVATRNTVAPAVTGTATNGSTLTTTTGTWTNSPTFTYQWYQDTSTVIAGATASTYVLTAGDVGHTVKCRVTATTANGSNTADSNSTATVS